MPHIMYIKEYNTIPKIIIYEIMILLIIIDHNSMNFTNAKLLLYL